MGFVFVSYSRADRDYVDRLAVHLTANGVPVWMDHSLDYGEVWASVIAARIGGCSAFVPVVTPHAIASEWVDREVSFAQELGKPVLPLQLLAGVRSIRLSNVHYEDVTGGAMPGPAFVDRLRHEVAAGAGGTRMTAAPAPSSRPSQAAPVDLRAALRSLLMKAAQEWKGTFGETGPRLAPMISHRQTAGMRAKLGVPDSAEVLALFDHSSSGSGAYGWAFTGAGVHFRNLGRSPYALTYRQLAEATVEVDDASAAVNGYSVITMRPHNAKVVVRLLEQLQDLLRSTA